MVVAKDLNRFLTVAPENVHLCVLVDEIRELRDKVNDIQQNGKKLYSDAFERKCPDVGVADKSNLKLDEDFNVGSKGSVSQCRTVQFSNQKKRRHPPIIGVKSNSCSLKGVPRPPKIHEYYIGRLCISTKAEELKSYLTDWH